MIQELYLHTHLAINNGREAEVVKNLSAIAPHSDRAIFSQALIIKPIDLGDLPAFVIATDKGDSVRVTDL